MTNRRFRSILIACALTLVPWLGAPASAQTGDVRMEWLSWSIFRFTAPNGTVILTNPFIKNPDSKVSVADFPKVDAILVADGHGDEVGSTDEIAIPTKAAIITTFEMWSAWFEPRKVPMSQVRRGNAGDWNKFDGVTIRNVNSVHSSGTSDKFYGGQAMGFIMHFDNGLNVYFAGSTALTRDMELWGSLYKPQVAILPLSGGRDVRDIVQMVRLLRTGNPNLKTIIPHHHRLQPPAGAPTPADLAKALKDAKLPVTVLNPEPMKVYTLAK